jgi:hypothetical protein
MFVPDEAALCACPDSAEKKEAVRLKGDFVRPPQGNRYIGPRGWPDCRSCRGRGFYMPPERRR